MTYRLVCGNKESGLSENLNAMDLATGHIAQPRILIYDHPLDISHLITSLELAIDTNPFVAGRVADLEKNAPRIVANNAGVLFGHRRCSGAMPKYGPENPVESTLDYTDFCPQIDESAIDENTPLLQILVSEFRTGTILSFVRPHFLSDAWSIWRFLAGWASIARGEVSPEFNFSRSSFQSQLAGAKVSTHRKIAPSRFRDRFLRLSSGAIEKRIFRVSEETVNALVTLAESQLADEVWVTRQDLLVAYLWKIIVEAANVATGATVVFSMLRSIRKDFGLDMQYFGNAVANLAYEDRKSAVLEKTAPEIALDIRRHVKTLTGEKIREKSDFFSLESKSAGASSLHKFHVFFNNCTKFPVYEIDFGTGRPVWNDIVRGGGFRREVLIFQTPQMDGGYDCHVSLPQAEMQNFTDIVAKLHLGRDIDQCV